MNSDHNPLAQSKVEFWVEKDRFVFNHGMTVQKCAFFDRAMFIVRFMSRPESSFPKSPKS